MTVEKIEVTRDDILKATAEITAKEGTMTETMINEIPMMLLVLPLIAKDLCDELFRVRDEEDA